ncbi:MAG: alpha/beta fold hydrolase [Actinomycetota bacterium]
MTDAAFDEAVQEFLLGEVRPARLREPRSADRFDGVEPQMVASPVGELAAWRLGDGPAVLLVHGWQDDSSLWSPLIDELARRGRSLVAFDLPAHGVSGGDWGLGSEGTNGVLAVAGELGPIDAVVAHSFGAACAALAMTEGLAVERAALVGTPLLAGGNRWLRRAEQLGVPREVAEAAKRIYDDKQGPRRAGYSGRAVISALDADLLLVHSTDDERYPFSDAVEVAPLCRRAELFAVQGLTHRRSARAPEVVARIADFVTTNQRL